MFFFVFFPLHLSDWNCKYDNTLYLITSSETVRVLDIYVRTCTINPFKLVREARALKYTT